MLVCQCVWVCACRCGGVSVSVCVGVNVHTGRTYLYLGKSIIWCIGLAMRTICRNLTKLLLLGVFYEKTREVVYCLKQVFHWPDLVKCFQLPEGKGPMAHLLCVWTNSTCQVSLFFQNFAPVWVNACVPVCVCVRVCVRLWWACLCGCVWGWVYIYR